MQPQVLQVQDIHRAIKENGISNYLDCLLQNSYGDYYFVEYYRDIDNGDGIKIADGWHDVPISPGDGDDEEFSPKVCEYIVFRPVFVPTQLAYFVIDALRLRSQVMNIGTGSYDSDGPHGGRLEYYVKAEDGKFRKVSKDTIRVEHL